MPRFLPVSLSAPPKWLRRRTRRTRPPARRALAFEQLESRDVPATYFWVPTIPGAFDWTNGSNWTGGPAGTFPNAVNDVANLTAPLLGNQLIRLNGAITVGTLNIGSTSPNGSFTVAGRGGSLTFDVSSGAATLNDVNTGGDALLSAVVTLND